MEAYNAHKGFILSYVKYYVVEAAIHFFDMADHNDAPTQNMPPHFENPNIQKDWVYETLGLFIDKYIFPAWSDHKIESFHLGTREVKQVWYIQVQLANGNTVKIPTWNSEQIHGSLGKGPGNELWSSCVAAGNGVRVLSTTY